MLIKRRPGVMITYPMVRKVEYYSVRNQSEYYRCIRFLLSTESQVKYLLILHIFRFYLLISKYISMNSIYDPTEGRTQELQTLS